MLPHIYGDEPAPVMEFKRPAAEFSAELTPFTGLKSSSAEVAVTSQSLAVSFFGLRLGYEASVYNWRKADKDSFFSETKEPWDELHNLSLSFRSAFPLPRGIILLYGIRADSRFERQMSDSFGGGGNVMLLKRFGDRWALTAGAAGSYHPLRSTFLPAAGLLYDSTDTYGFSASIGMPTSMRYRVNKRLTLELAAGLSSGTYRLKDNSPVSEKGYFRHRSLSPRLGIRFTPLEKLEISAACIYHIDREWRIYDSGGSRVGRARLDSGPGLVAGVTWRF